MNWRRWIKSFTQTTQVGPCSDSKCIIISFARIEQECKDQFDAPTCQLTVSIKKKKFCLNEYLEIVLRKHATICKLKLLTISYVSSNFESFQLLIHKIQACFMDRKPIKVSFKTILVSLPSFCPLAWQPSTSVTMCSEHWMLMAMDHWISESMFWSWTWFRPKLQRKN